MRKTTMNGSSFLDVSMMKKLHISDPFAVPARGPETVPPEPGDYWVFVQTRRVVRGWPKDGDIYFKASDIVVTSSNVVRITVLPDGNLRFAGLSP